MLDQAVGMTMTNCSEANFPWMYKVCPNMKKATYSEGEDPNFSEVVALGSQVMFSQVDDLRAKCEEVDVPMINVMFKTFDEMEKSVSLTAEVLGDDAIEIAKAYNKDLKEVLTDIKDKTDKLTDAEKPKVLTGNSVYKLDLDGKGTIISDWIDACGGIQVVEGDTTGKTTAEYSLEQIIAWDPDIIITDVPSQVDEILADLDWAAISAVQKKQVYVNPQGVFMWNRYGVEELLQLKWASKLFHPTLFEDVDIEQAVMDFYKTYLHYDLTAEEAQLIIAAKDPDGSDHAVKGSD
jgi:iron complex transport system substrate-binding protein